MFAKFVFNFQMSLSTFKPRQWNEQLIHIEQLKSIDDFKSRFGNTFKDTSTLCLNS